MVTVRLYSKLKTSWKSDVFTNKVGNISRYFVGVFNKTVIPLVLVGYVMIITNPYQTRTHGIIVKYTGFTDTGSGRDSTQHDIKQFG